MVYLIFFPESVEVVTLVAKAVRNVTNEKDDLKMIKTKGFPI